jgi:hypothetical protein
VPRLTRDHKVVVVPLISYRYSMKISLKNTGSPGTTEGGRSDYSRHYVRVEFRHSWLKGLRIENIISDVERENALNTVSGGEGFGVWSLGCGVWGVGCGVLEFGDSVIRDLGLWGLGVGFLGFGVWGLGGLGFLGFWEFGIWDEGVSGSGFEGFRVIRGFGIWGLGFGVQTLEIRDRGLRYAYGRRSMRFHCIAGQARSSLIDQSGRGFGK